MLVRRYLYRELTLNTLVVACVLLVIFITNQFVHYVQVAATGQITMLAVVKLMALQVPMLAGYLLPLAFYLSILLSLGRVCLDNEMTILQSCGLSDAKLWQWVLSYALGLMLVVGLLIIWLEPLTQQWRKDILERSIGKMSMQKLIAQQFRQLPRGGVFYAKDIARRQQHMQQVFFAERGQKRGESGRPVWDVTIAASADQRWLANEHADFMVFNHGYRIIGTPGERRFRLIKFSHYGVRLNDRRFILSDWPLDATTKSLWAIYQHNAEAASMLHWRVAMPISVLLFAIIALPLSRVKPRQGKFAQFVPAILIYIAYADLMFIGRAWIKQGKVSATVGLWWLHGLMLLLGLVIILLKRRVQRV